MSRRKPRVLLGCVLAVFTCLSVVRAGEPLNGPDAPAPVHVEPASDIFARANADFDKAVSLRTSDGAQSRRLLGAAQEQYERLIDERGLHSAGLYYNLGNAQFLRGDVGHAVLSYLRARRLGGMTPELAANLATARASVGVQAAPVATAWTPAQAVRAIPPRVLLGATAVLLVAAWLAAFMRLLLVSGHGRTSALRPPRWAIGVLFLGAIITGASLWWGQRSSDQSQAGVLVADHVTGRKGPDEQGYEATFTQPLRAGLEVTVLETRGKWRLVRLSDGRTTWVPQWTVEMV